MLNPIFKVRHYPPIVTSVTFVIHAFFKNIDLHKITVHRNDSMLKMVKTAVVTEITRAQ